MQSAILKLIALAALTLAAGAGLAAEQDGEFQGAKETEYPDWFKESFLELGEDIREAADAGKRAVLFFHQDGCPYCNALVERNLSQKDIRETMRKHFDVIALNMWGDRELTIGGKAYTEKSFAAALKVQFTPTLIFFDETGDIALRLNGYHPPQDFTLALEYVAGRKEKQGPYPEFLAANKQAPPAGELNEATFCSAADTADAQRPLAVLFEQKQCPNCDTLHERALAEQETRALLEQFDCIQLDMWSDTPIVTPANEHTKARDWAKTLGISYAPTIVYFDPQGNEVIRSEAFFKIFHTQSMMDYVASSAYKTEPSFQHYISARADALREQGIDVDIWR